MAILYGDNGTGKTTILRMIHNLLSPGPGGGHKTAVAKTIFREFSVYFSNGVKVDARRKNPNAGNFELLLTLPKGSTRRAAFIIDEDEAIPNTGPHSDAQDDLIKEISRAIHLRSYYLSDDRILDSDFIDKRRTVREPWRFRFRPSIGEDSIRESDDSPQVSSAIYRATGWARQQALQGASDGSVSTNTIYADVVKHLAEMPRIATAEGESSTRQHLLTMIERTGQRSRDQSRFGLLPAVNTDDLLQYVPLVRDEDFPLVSGILKPYLGGTDARLDALESTHRTLSFFVDTLNRFLKGKYVMFDIQGGLRIYTDEGDALDEGSLSSGESQLLTLFCNILSARESPAIFVIDEPELSLNVKWQRALVDALLGCARDSEIQLILASHSIELLTAHREQVVGLKV
ncbi:AAA family ATPase [Streptomyces sp. DSM 3412]|uniref:AAA family ATPase n=1 Tax=Streptomyces gottesmaniae TaxID=3075518 RepID=A0ABU2Z3Y9_9ACTN|nr:AAA family ATPase [Streptomyces sp. DSM 3412]MDT0571156.1 AAA family ATPase [Streptomyces sp. DSM 3412]